MRSGSVYPRGRPLVAVGSFHRTSGLLRLPRETMFNLVSVQFCTANYSNAIDSLERDALWEQALCMLWSPGYSQIFSDAYVTSSCRILMSALEGRKQWGIALALLVSMREREIVPDAPTFNFSMSACVEVFQWERALELFDNRPTAPMEQEEISYTIALKACERGQQWEAALDLLLQSSWRRNEPCASLFAYRATVRACKEAQRWEWVLALLEAMPSCTGGQPDASIYGMALVACGRGHQWRFVARLLEDLIGYGLRPSRAVSSSIISCLDGFGFVLLHGLCTSIRQGMCAMLVTRDHGSRGRDHTMSQCRGGTTFQALSGSNDLYSDDVNRFVFGLDTLHGLGQLNREVEGPLLRLLLHPAFSRLESLQFTRVDESEWAAHRLLDPWLEDQCTLGRHHTRDALSELLCHAGLWEEEAPSVRRMRSGLARGLLVQQPVLVGRLLPPSKPAAKGIGIWLDGELYITRSQRPIAFEASYIGYAGLRNVSLDDWAEALEILCDLVCEGLTPDLVLCNSVITACSRGAAWSSALAVLEQVRDLMVSPDRLTFNAVISALQEGGQWSHALDLFTKLCSDGAELDIVGFSAAITACERGSLWTRALCLLHEATVRCAQPDVIACSAVVSACSKASQWLHVLAVLEAMREVGLGPNVVTYSSAINVCTRGHRWPMALNLLTLMRADAVRSDAIVCSAAMNACSKGRQWGWALHLLHEMRLDGVEPNEVSYLVGLDACSRGTCWTLALTLLRALERSALRLCVEAYNAAITASERATRWVTALALLDAVGGQGLRRDVITCCAAISACSRSQFWAGALHLLDDVSHSSMRANTIVFTAAASTCTRAQHWALALQILFEMRRICIDFDLIGCNAAINACAKGLQWISALCFLGLMQRRSIAPDEFTNRAVAAARGITSPSTWVPCSFDDS